MEQAVLLPFSILCLTVLLFIFLLKRLKQPYLIAYLLAGVILGPYVTGVLTNTAAIDSLGEVGIILLMFFLGLELKIPDNSHILFQPFVAQSIKTLLSVIMAFLAGRLLHYNAATIFLLSVIFMFNSTAVVRDYLQKNGELRTKPGITILNILLLQDVMLAPVLTAFQFLQYKDPGIFKLLLAISSCILIFFLLRATRNKNLFRLPFSVDISNDHDLQVFAGAAICFGFALLASFAGLTASIGGFFAGVFLGRTKEFDWLDTTLHPFKVFFVAAFFLSLGLRIDTGYIMQHALFVISITCLVILINSIFSALVFRLLKYTARTSIYAGALLSQTGEFSLLACAMAFQLHIIDAEFYKLAVTVACLSLLFSTAWITLLRKRVYNGTSTLLG